jgi:predicted Rossmann fold nucleotide-binding protein DprA/Smf involved in DNA uptake
MSPIRETILKPWRSSRRTVSRVAGLADTRQQWRELVRLRARLGEVLPPDVIGRWLEAGTR